MAASDGDITALSSMKSPKWEVSSSPIGVSSEIGCCATSFVLRILSTARPMRLAISSEVGVPGTAGQVRFGITCGQDTTDRTTEVGAWLRKVVLGYYQYYAVPGNSTQLRIFSRRVCWLWRSVLVRPSQRAQVRWALSPLCGGRAAMVVPTATVTFGRMEGEGLLPVAPSLRIKRAKVGPSKTFYSSMPESPPPAGTVWHNKYSGATQEPLAARAAGWLAIWLAICSFIFCCISLGVGCAMWVATIQV